MAARYFVETVTGDYYSLGGEYARDTKNAQKKGC